MVAVLRLTGNATQPACEAARQRLVNALAKGRDATLFYKLAHASLSLLKFKRPVQTERARSATSLRWGSMGR